MWLPAYDEKAYWDYMNFSTRWSAGKTAIQTRPSRPCYDSSKPHKARAKQDGQAPDDPVNDTDLLHSSAARSINDSDLTSLTLAEAVTASQKNRYAAGIDRSHLGAMEAARALNA